MNELSAIWHSLLGNLSFLIAAVAFVFVVQKGRDEAERGLPRWTGLAKLDTWVPVAAVVGARVGGVLPSVQTYAHSPFNLALLYSGMSLFGALGAGMAAIAVISRNDLRRALRLTDAYSMYLPIGIAIYALGTFAYGASTGTPAPFPLGLPSPGHVGLRYPSEVYLGLGALGIWVGLRRLRRGQQQVPGQSTGIFLLAFSALRALVDLTQFGTGPWPWADPVVSATFAVVGASIWVLARRFQTAAETVPSRLKTAP